MIITTMEQPAQPMNPDEPKTRILSQIIKTKEESIDTQNPIKKEGEKKYEEVKSQEITKTIQQTIELTNHILGNRHKLAEPAASELENNNTNLRQLERQLQTELQNTNTNRITAINQAIKSGNLTETELAFSNTTDLRKYLLGPKQEKNQADKINKIAYLLRLQSIPDQYITVSNSLIKLCNTISTLKKPITYKPSLVNYYQNKPMDQNERQKIENIINNLEELQDECLLLMELTTF